MPSVYKQLRDAVITAIKAGTFAGICDVTPKRVYPRKFPWYAEDLPLPCCVVAYVPEVFTDRVNSKNDIDYRLQITFMKAISGSTLGDEADEMILWREAAMDLFRLQRIPASTLAYLCKIEPGPVFDEGAHRNKIDATSFLLHCWVRR